ncbi:unnamed protein product [Spirodela intermedia]|uniref:Uncharacterized protein n=1 Tax=Spirodela intermedia TaxID=51605 RepID=A0A7I8KYQ9_SPIIN|nr:unnamed protein product [Spirodela intermedia]
MIPRYCKLGHPFVDSRIEDSKYVDSKVGFFSKIGALWIQTHILFIFHVTATSICIRTSQHFNLGSKCHYQNSTLQLDRGRFIVISSRPYNRRLNQSSIRSSRANLFAQVSTNKNLYTPNVILKCYMCGKSEHKSNIYTKCGTVEENFIEFDIKDTLSHSLVASLVDSKVEDSEYVDLEAAFDWIDGSGLLSFERLHSASSPPSSLPGLDVSTSEAKIAHGISQKTSIAAPTSPYSFFYK